MSVFLFLLYEFVGSIRAKTGVLLLCFLLLIFSFLAIFSCFFLLGESKSDDRLLIPGEITLYLSGQLSVQQVQDLYLNIREMQEVKQINYLFRQEIDRGLVANALLVRAVNTDIVPALHSVLDQLEGVARVESRASADKATVSLSTALRIGLLVGLAITVLASLVLARMGFAELLRSCTAKMKLLRLSGIAEQTIRFPIAAMGAISGLIATTLLIAVIYLLHSFAAANPHQFLNTVSGLIDPGTVLITSLLCVPLGLLLGSLGGILGASLTESCSS